MIVRVVDKQQFPADLRRSGCVAPMAARYGGTVARKCAPRRHSTAEAAQLTDTGGGVEPTPGVVVRRGRASEVVGYADL